MRGVSTPIAEAILVIAAVTATMIVASAILYNASYLGGRIASASAAAARGLSERAVFVYGFVNESDGCHYLFLKNVGEAPIAGVEDATLILGNGSETFLLEYMDYCSQGLGCWSYREIENPNGVWEQRETLEVKACPPLGVEPPYRVVMVLPSGSRLEAGYTG
ncbi:hypothetical protein [Pyrodictium abyssi]|uniref:Flagellin n=1 Tax=Pyrodictium abyssi TaxID=54256 RepID=A0ABM8ITN8_9CREN|nr:hypothetical protein PABY_05040 [Pyrodictium abyssi]